MKTEFVIGVIAGIITVAIVFKIAYKLTGKSYFNSENYDERQELVRGKAYRYAFFTGLFLDLVWMLTTELTSALPVTDSLALFIIMMISIDVYAIYSVVNDAYFGVGTNSKRYTWFLLVVVAINLTGGITTIVNHGIALPLGLTGSANLVVAIAFLPIFAAMGLKAMKTGEEESEDEES